MTPEIQALVTKLEAEAAEWKSGLRTHQWLGTDFCFTSAELLEEAAAALVQQAQENGNERVDNRESGSGVAALMPHCWHRDDSDVVAGLKAQLARVTAELEESLKDAKRWKAVGELYERKWETEVQPQIKAAKAALSAHREALEKYGQHLVNCKSMKHPAVLYPKAYKDKECTCGFANRLTALASPRQIEQEHDKNDDHTRVVDSSQPDRAALPQRPTS